ncbi:hypothetical protein PLESTB_001924000 [Pleodorina starrii]|uniref:Uncharacterized protein n=1 Tax=Pleodorina starrii TaxID=330485 RepID=A0A9W6C1Q4_9CHLO|nr:hypothetical protein PLESTB_001924000 [Pleodorina starrii]
MVSALHARQGSAADDEVGFADLWPVFLFLDPARIGPDAREVPASVMARYKARQVRKLHWISPQDDRLVPLMDLWQRQQFAASGYTLTALAALFDRSPGLKGDYLSAFDCIAWNAPHLMALAQASLARRSGHAAVTGDPGDCEDQSVLRVFLAMQADEGRKQRLVVHDGEACGKYQGVALQKRYLDRAKASLAPGAGLQEIESHLLRHIELLDLLAKGRRVATSILAARLGEMRDYVQGLESWAVRAPMAFATRPTAMEKGSVPLRTASTRPKSRRPSSSRRMTQRRSRGSLRRSWAALPFSVTSTASRSRCSIYCFCPEIWAARALGALRFNRRPVSEAEIAPLRTWLEATHVPEPGLDLIETSCRDIAVTVADLQNMLLWPPMREMRDRSS